MGANYFGEIRTTSFNGQLLSSVLPHTFDNLLFVFILWCFVGVAVSVAGGVSFVVRDD